MAAEDLQAGVCDLHGLAAHVGLSQSRCPCRVEALLQLAGGLPDQMTHGAHLDLHLCQLEGDRLLLRDRLAESHALLRVRDSEVLDGTGETNSQSGTAHPAQVDQARTVDAGTGILSFFVWAHHQFIAGIDPRMANVFTVTTVLISIPLAELCFVYIATLYGGSITLTTPMLWALAFVAEFLLGGVTGIYLGASGADIYFHDTYFVLAHFHYTFFPIAIIGVFAGLTFWYPKIFGRMMNELAGKIHFWGTIITFNCIFIPLFVLGAAGQHRRIYDYGNFPDLALPAFQDMRVFATASLVVMLFFQVVFLLNFFLSLWRGKRAPLNPWKSNTLEWTAPSPPPHGNFAELPTVYRGPYEYGVPGREDDYFPQNVPG